MIQICLILYIYIVLMSTTYYYRLFKIIPQHFQNMEPNKIFPPSSILNSQTIFWIMT